MFRYFSLFFFGDRAQQKKKKSHHAERKANFQFKSINIDLFMAETKMFGKWYILTLYNIFHSSITFQISGELFEFFSGYLSLHILSINMFFFLFEGKV